MSDQIWLAVASHKSPPAPVSQCEYDIGRMEWRIELLDGSRWLFHGDLERRNSAGWPLHHPFSRVAQTMAIRLHEFEMVRGLSKSPEDGKNG